MVKYLVARSPVCSPCHKGRQALRMHNDHVASSWCHFGFFLSFFIYCFLLFLLLITFHFSLLRFPLMHHVECHKKKGHIFYVSGEHFRQRKRQRYKEMDNRIREKKRGRKQSQPKPSITLALHTFLYTEEKKNYLFFPVMFLVHILGNRAVMDISIVIHIYCMYILYRDARRTSKYLALERKSRGQQ